MNRLQVFFKRITRLILRNNIIQAVSYLFIGGVTFLVIMVSLLVLTDIFGLWYLLSSIISDIIGIIVHFTLNKNITFQNKSRKLVQQFSLYISIGAVSLLLNTLLMFIFVEFFDIWYLLAKFLIAFMLFIFNFLAHKKLTFGMIK